MDRGGEMNEKRKRRNKRGKEGIDRGDEMNGH